MKINVFIVGCALLLSMASADCSAPAALDLTNWTPDSVGSPNSEWTIANTDTWTQGPNTGHPTFVLSDYDSCTSSFTFRINVAGSGGDDDFVGCALGYNLGDHSQASPNWILVDWKKADQTHNGQTALKGLSVSRVTGNAPSLANFWDHSDQVFELARGATLGSTGWTHDFDHEITVGYSADRLTVHVDGNLEIDIAGTASFPCSGQFAFFSMSQPQTSFQFLDTDCYVPPLAPPLGCVLDPVDLTTWTADSAGNPATEWTYVDDNNIRQIPNTDQPTFVVSNWPACGSELEFNIQVQNGAGDDDFIGCALGYNVGDHSAASPEWILVDWKKGDQVHNGQPALKGLAVSRVEGPAPSLANFWDHSGQVTELTRGLTLGSTGWDHGFTHNFKVAFSATHLTVHVDGVLEIDLPGTYYCGGNFAFFSMSQPEVYFNAVSRTCYIPPPGPPPSSNFGPVFDARCSGFPTTP